MGVNIMPAVAGGVAMAAALIVVHRSGSPRLQSTGWMMVGNLAAVWFGNWFFASASPWGWFIAIDFVAGFAICWRSAGQLQAYIGGIYFLQIMVHVIFGLSGASAFGEADYLNLLAFGGGCQLLILATGAIHGRGRKVADPGGGLCGVDRAGEPHSARVEPGP